MKVWNKIVNIIRHTWLTIYENLSSHFKILEKRLKSKIVLNLFGSNVEKKSRSRDQESTKPTKRLWPQDKNKSKQQQQQQPYILIRT